MTTNLADLQAENDALRAALDRVNTLANTLEANSRDGHSPLLWGGVAAAIRDALAGK